MIINLILLLLLPTLVSSAGAPRKTYNHSSISGDCVMFRTSSYNEVETSYIEVESSSMLHKDQQQIEIRNFSGNGDQKLRRPSVNSSTVYDSLFHEDSFSSIFSAEKTQPAFTVTRSKIRKIELTVKDASKPFKIISANLTYFWGADKLPPTNENEDRCSALISDFPHIAPFNFLSATGKRLTHFAWLCPAGTVCCAWECCEEREHRRPLTILELAALIVIGGLLICLSLYCMCLDCKRSTSPTGLRRYQKDAPANNENKQSTSLEKKYPEEIENDTRDQQQSESDSDSESPDDNLMTID